ncbi:MAG: hypothetical protein EA362_11470 [Saprospirales bacterium]|nr:MAG: hypothetical protein EA362_11470 [Saprospirales bacterium]
MAEKIHLNIYRLKTPFRVVFFFFILLFSFFASANTSQAQELDPIELEAKHLMSDSVGLIYDLPHSHEETERQLYYSGLIKQVVGKSTQGKEIKVSVFDYLFFLQSKISESRDVSVESNTGSFLLKDLGVQKNLKNEELRNSSIVRDKNDGIIKIYVNLE